MRSRPAVLHHIVGIATGLTVVAGLALVSTPVYARNSTAHHRPLGARSHRAAIFVANPPEQKPRVVVLTDIGNEPDDAESMVRFLLYSNEFDIESLLATTSRHMRDKVRPELIEERVRAYGQIVDNLRVHAKGYPDMSTLLSRIHVGSSTYGMVGVGQKKDTSASNDIIRIVDNPNDNRPVWVLIWGGAHDLAQSLYRVRQTRSPKQVAAFVAKLRVYSISDQDDAGPWIRLNFPSINWIVSLHGYGKYKLATWAGISGEKFYNLDPGGPDSTKITNEWLAANVRRGPLGSLYPEWKFIMEGDTPSFLYLIPNGLGVREHPEYGSWGGRYERISNYDNIYTNTFDTVTGVNGLPIGSPFATVWRWRDAYQDDFAARIDWSLSPNYADANHNPVAVINGQAGLAPITLEGQPGDRITLSAKGSNDPDGQTLTYRWIQYREVENLRRIPELAMDVTDPTKAIVTLPTVPEDTKLHFILEVRDSGTPALYTYRRAIITVHPKKKD